MYRESETDIPAGHEGASCLLVLSSSFLWWSAKLHWMDSETHDGGPEV